MDEKVIRVGVSISSNADGKYGFAEHLEENGVRTRLLSESGFIYDSVEAAAHAYWQQHS